MRPEKISTIPPKKVDFWGRRKFYQTWFGPLFEKKLFFELLGSLRTLGLGKLKLMPRAQFRSKSKNWVFLSLWDAGNPIWRPFLEIRKMPQFVPFQQVNGGQFKNSLQYLRRIILENLLYFINLKPIWNTLLRNNFLKTFVCKVSSEKNIHVKTIFDYFKTYLEYTLEK